MKNILAVSIFCFALSFAQNVSATATAPTEQSFSVTGYFCANPWDGHEGPNYGGSQRDADRKASQRCYPYQFHRDTEFKSEPSKHCREYYWGSKSTAVYSCAKL